MPTRNLSVTLIIRYFTIGGLERVVIDLANGLARAGIHTKVVVMAADKRNALMTELGEAVEVVLLPTSGIRRFLALRQETRNSIVHLHFGDGRIHPFIRIGLLGRKAVLTYHSVYTHKRNLFLNTLDRLCSTALSAIIAVSDSAALFCTAEVGIPKHRVRVIRNGVAAQPRTARKTLTSQGLRLVALASLYPHKNQSVVLEALALARVHSKDLHLDVIGDGPMLPALFLQARRLELQNHITWHGGIWHKDLVSGILGGADLFVSASRSEGLPLSVLEAMCHELPLVLSDIPSHHETAGEAALYFSCDDPEGLAATLKHLTSNRERLAVLARESSLRAEWFDIQKFVSGHVKLYHELSSNG